MSEIEESENGILVDFNSNDTFSKIKSAVEAEPIEDIKPKPKRKPSKKDIIAEAVEAEPIEDIKPKPKRKPTKKIIVEPVETFEDIEDIKPKAKATRKPKKEIIIEDLTPVIEPVEDIKPVEKNIKTLEQVDCGKCGKQMTKTTLRYHHEKTCPGEKVNKEELPVKKRIIKEKVVEIPKVEKSNLYKDRLNEQIKLKKESMKKLASNIA